MIERKASRKQHRFSLLFSISILERKRILFCPGEGKNDVDKNKKFIPTPVPQPLSSFPFSLSPLFHEGAACKRGGIGGGIRLRAARNRANRMARCKKEIMRARR